MPRSMIKIWKLHTCFVSLKDLQQLLPQGVRVKGVQGPSAIDGFCRIGPWAQGWQGEMETILRWGTKRGNKRRHVWRAALLVYEMLHSESVMFSHLTFSHAQLRNTWLPNIHPCKNTAANSCWSFRTAATQHKKDTQKRFFHILKKSSFFTPKKFTSFFFDTL